MPWWLWAVAALVLTAIAAGAWWLLRSEHPAPSIKPATTSVQTSFVGSSACASCHRTAFEQWSISQHALAMQPASAGTVLGDFDNASFTYAGVTSTLFKRDGKFFARTDGPDGKLADFEIKYTFGIAPLQQYLIELPRGHLQALTIAWDTRPKSQGGQRWFHLYPGQAIKAGDPLHWTGLQQNWNFMCADCHSTDVRKHYDAATKSYATTWSEISVGCEACHGPGSAHIAWTRKEGDWRGAGTTKGLAIALDERRDVRWVLDAKSGQPQRSAQRGSSREIEVCARCHARRGQLTDAIHAGQPLADGFRVALLEPGLYHVDGQMRDEVYNHGSFLHSKMHAAGVTCSDCHSPHSGSLHAPGNGTCLQCHSAQKYDAPGHHFHEAGTPGAQCASCHMPRVTYMVIDPRHDHSFRVPRPDLSARLGTPNACADCHRDRPAAWAAKEIERRFGPARRGFQTFSAAFHDADRGAPGWSGALLRIVEDRRQPAMVRASALSRLSRRLTPVTIDVLSRALNDSDSLVREAAVAGLAPADADTRLRFLPRMLTDPSRAVRIEAARALAPLEARVGAEQKTAFAQALDEYVAVQRFNADRPESQVNLAMLLAERGDFEAATRAFETAIELDRTFVPAYVNWADVLRARGQDAQAEAILRRAIRAMPEAAAAHHALGLSLVRQKRAPEAIASLATAARLAPDDPRYAYVWGVALHDSGQRTNAMRVLDQALARHPYDAEILFALASYALEARRPDLAKQYAERLREIAPDDPQVRRLLAATADR